MTAPSDHDREQQPMTMDAAAGSADPETLPRHRGRALGRAALACALATVAGLVLLGIGFTVVTVGDAHATQDFSWYFALFVIPAVVILTVLLFLAAAILGIVGIAQADGRDRRPAVVAIVVAVAVIAIYVAGAFILGALLSPGVTVA